MRTFLFIVALWSLIFHVIQPYVSIITTTAKIAMTPF